MIALHGIKTEQSVPFTLSLTRCPLLSLFFNKFFTELVISILKHYTMAIARSDFCVHTYGTHSVGFCSHVMYWNLDCCFYCSDLLFGRSIHIMCVCLCDCKLVNS